MAAGLEESQVDLLGVEVEVEVVAGRLAHNPSCGPGLVLQRLPQRRDVDLQTRG